MSIVRVRAYHCPPSPRQVLPLCRFLGLASCSPFRQVNKPRNSLSSSFCTSCAHPFFISFTAPYFLCLFFPCAYVTNITSNFSPSPNNELSFPFQLFFFVTNHLKCSSICPSFCVQTSTQTCSHHLSRASLRNILSHRLNRPRCGHRIFCFTPRLSSPSKTCRNTNFPVSRKQATSNSLHNTFHVWTHNITTSPSASAHLSTKLSNVSSRRAPTNWKWTCRD